MTKENLKNTLFELFQGWNIFARGERRVDGVGLGWVGLTYFRMGFSLVCDTNNCPNLNQFQIGNIESYQKEL